SGTGPLAAADRRCANGKPKPVRLVNTVLVRKTAVQPSSRFLQRPLHLRRVRISALRFGDPRIQALCQALSGFAHVPAGFRHRDLRPRVAALFGRPYSAAQMTYDLRRLRLRGLIERSVGTHRYHVTPYGLRVTFFYSKLYLRIFRPYAPALEPFSDAIPRPI